MLGTAVRRSKSGLYLLKSLSIISFCLSLLVACGSMQLAEPGWEIEPGSFRYTIADRYGLDNNGNGIVDMPNSAAYVQDVLDVVLNFEAAAGSFPSRWPLAEGEDAGLGNLEGPWRWTLAPLEIYQDAANLPVPSSSESGFSGRNEGGVLTVFSASPEISVSLYEGTWSITLARVDESDPYGDAIYWAYAEPTFQDYLIVQLGDSFSSGQGAPEMKSIFGVWGDDGTVQDFPNIQSNYDHCIGGLNDPIDSDCVRRAAFGTMVNFEHEQAHRSSNTWGSVAAQAVEAYDPTTSVTYVNLAATGALIKHLTTSYENPGSIGTRDLELPAIFVDMIPEILLARPLPPQLEQMRDLVGPRPIDALLLSVGGNDAGFAPVIAAYLLSEGILLGAPQGPTSSRIQEAIGDGHWGWIGDIKSWMFDLFGFVDFPEQILGIRGLLLAYRELGDVLGSYGITDSSIVYVAEYPDPLVTNHRFTRDHGGARVCEGDILTQATPFDYEITPAEQEEIRSWLIVPLNNQIANATYFTGWNLINSATAMYGRPVCPGVDDRLLNRAKEAEEAQGDTSGMVHPNAAGHAAIADELLRQFHLPNQVRAEADLNMPNDLNFAVEEVLRSEYDLKAPGSTYAMWANDNRLYYLERLGPSLDEQPPSSVWGTFGFPYAANRLYLNLSQGWCAEGESLELEMRPPVDTSGQNEEDRWTVRYIGALPEPALQIQREGDEGWESVATLLEYGSLLYNFSPEERASGRFRVSLSNHSVSQSPPEEFSKLKLRSSYYNDWGAVQLRTSCRRTNVPGTATAAFTSPQAQPQPASP